MSKKFTHLPLFQAEMGGMTKHNTNTQNTPTRKKKDVHHSLARCRAHPPLIREVHQPKPLELQSTLWEERDLILLSTLIKFTSRYPFLYSANISALYITS